MSETKAAVAGRSGAASGARDCPMMDAPTMAQLKTCVKESKALSRDVLAWLSARDRDDKAAWVASSVDAGKVIFQPWTMEILFVLAVAGRTRFTELQSMLGISSRTLSDKLQTLRAAALVERAVYDEQPVRIEYFLSKEGVTTAALATPLFAHLNQRAQGRA
jgi:DNA-binding HxlR family transcriptional regulator